MLVQALAAYADEYLQMDIQDPAFETKAVRFWLEIDEQGRFLGLVERVQDVEVKGKDGKPKTEQRVETMRAPRCPVNRKGVGYGLPACDFASYALGPGAWSKESDKDKHQRHHDAFKKRLHGMAERLDDPGLAACIRFYEDKDSLARAAQAFEDKKGASTDKIALVMRPSSGMDPGGPVFERPAVAKAWRAIYKKHFLERHEKAGQGVCLISGEYGPLAITHEAIKGASNLGGQGAGVALMSFDKNAFRSYNWDKNKNSPVHPERAFAYTLALGDLMVPGRHRQGASKDVVLPTRWDCGQSAFLFWTRDPEDHDPFSLVNASDPEQVRALFTRQLAGRPPGELQANRFHLLRVGATGGRLAVQDFLEDSLANVHACVRGWFDSLRVPDVFRQGEPADPPPLWWLLRAMLPPSQGLEVKPAGRFASTLARRALFGEPVGHVVLAAALNRLFAAQGGDRHNTARMGLIRLSVNDILFKKGENLMPDSLDTAIDHPAYLCGRLMALYEALQWQAHARTGDDGKSEGGVNVTVADRYYGMAMTNPALAFTSLEKLSFAHRQKLRRDNRGAFKAITAKMDDIMQRIGDVRGAFPGRLSLEDQGRFALGYHSQCAEDRQAAAAARAKKQAETETVDE
jgi:CRISPR-associated protein Csd1